MEPLPDGIDASRLPGVVGQALGRPAGHPAAPGPVRCRRIDDPRVPSTRGVYLLSGTAAAAAREPWAVVLKVLAPAAGGGLPREAALYRSGFLAGLAGGLVAPRCYGVDALPDGAAALWLEYLVDAVGPVWPVARFALAARHLGEFAGAHTPGGTLPPWPWLRRADPAGVAGETERRAGFFADLAATETGGHPLVRWAFPPDVVAGLRRLWAGRRPLLDALARCPPAVCRGDAQRRNLFARRDPGGRERTVGIDWPHLAASHVGTDAATLVHQALIYFDADIEDATRLDRAVCDAYTEGLAAGGWGLEPRVVRLAYALRLVFAHGAPEWEWLLRNVLDASRHARVEALHGGRPLGEVLDRRAAVTRYLLHLADEAADLAGRLPEGGRW